MNSIDDGGNVFPTPEGYYGGARMRDYFAAAALPGVIQSCGRDTMNGVQPEQYFAQKAYAIADAMIEMRG